MNESTGDHILQAIIARHKTDSSRGIYSVCSAHPYVLRAALRQARDEGSPLLVEATCNQVNQFGGYTGWTPAAFLEELNRVADEESFPKHQLVLGGDHLGPSPWKREAAAEAMKKGRHLVRDYVRAGYSKIHLDASMSCKGDPVPLPDDLVAERSAELAQVAEDAAKGLSGRPVYVIGTEVPTPGGAGEEEFEELQPTRPEMAQVTISNARKAFRARGLEAAWERVIGVVVQPGVEFGNRTVVEYRRAAAASLSRLIESHDQLVFEAHSTDYQTPSALRDLVRDHFCILKVGPWLTFAFREAVFALAEIEEELAKVHRSLSPSAIRESLERAMLSNPADWEGHYQGTEEEKAFLRRFSLSDRIRYYWQEEGVTRSLRRLIVNLSGKELPPALTSQFLPDQHEAIRQGSLSPEPEAILLDKVSRVLIHYSRACKMGAGTGRR